MLSDRLRTEAQPRSKNGQPAQRTAGVPSTSSIHIAACGPIERWTAGKSPAISRTTTGTVSASPIQNRCVMSMSSALGPLSSLTPAGSSAMPQIGQLPGPSWRISGCIGQVYIVSLDAGGFGGAGSIGFRYLAGSAKNFGAQPAQQKW